MRAHRGLSITRYWYASQFVRALGPVVYRRTRGEKIDEELVRLATVRRSVERRPAERARATLEGAGGRCGPRGQLIFELPPGVKIHFATTLVDMRNGIDGLRACVEQTLEKDPMSGHLFVFVGTWKGKVKTLFWDTQYGRFTVADSERASVAGFGKNRPAPDLRRLPGQEWGYSVPVIGTGSYSGVSSAFSGAVTL